MKVREVQRFEVLVERRCEGFGVRETGMQGPQFPFRHRRYVTNETMIERLRD